MLLKRNKLSKKQYLFCVYYARTRNVREAAAKAGYSIFPEKAGVKLLQRGEVREEIKRILSAEKSQSFSQLAKSGYERLAFGSVADAVRLLFVEEDFDTDSLDGMDLFNISEIKRPKSGGMEIKFFDRLKALQCLEKLENSFSDSANPFYIALEQGASAIKDNPNAVFKNVNKDKGM